jgi:hypothetical protein
MHIFIQRAGARLPPRPSFFPLTIGRKSNFDSLAGEFAQEARKTAGSAMAA